MRNTTIQLFTKQLIWLSIVFVNRFLVEDFGHEFQQISSFFRNGSDKLKLEAELKALIYLFDGKQVAIKDPIQITASLNVP